MATLIIRDYVRTRAQVAIEHVRTSCGPSMKASVDQGVWCYIVDKIAHQLWNNANKPWR